MVGPSTLLCVAITVLELSAPMQVLLAVLVATAAPLPRFVVQTPKAAKNDGLWCSAIALLDSTCELCGGDLSEGPRVCLSPSAPRATLGCRDPEQRHTCPALTTVDLADYPWRLVHAGSELPRSHTHAIVVQVVENTCTQAVVYAMLGDDLRGHNDDPTLTLVPVHDYSPAGGAVSSREGVFAWRVQRNVTTWHLDHEWLALLMQPPGTASDYVNYVTRVRVPGATHLPCNSTVFSEEALNLSQHLQLSYLRVRWHDFSATWIGVMWTVVLAAYQWAMWSRIWNTRPKLYALFVATLVSLHASLMIHFAYATYVVFTFAGLLVPVLVLWARALYWCCCAGSRATFKLPDPSVFSQFGNVAITVCLHALFMTMAWWKV